MPKPKAINRKKLVAFVLPIIRKEKLPMSEELEKLRHKQYVAERKLTAANFWGSTKAVRRLSFSAGELAVGQKIKAGTEVFHDGEGAEIQVTAYAVYRNMQDMQVPEYVVVRRVGEKDGGAFALLDSSGLTWNFQRETELKTYGRDEAVSLTALKEGQRCLIFPDIEASAKLSETQVAGQSVLVLP